MLYQKASASRGWCKPGAVDSAENHSGVSVLKSIPVTGKRDE